MATLTRLQVFSQRFTPNQIVPGGVSTLIFTIDNSFNPVAVDNLSFSNTLPTSLEIVDTVNTTLASASPNIGSTALLKATTTCNGGVLTAEPGTRLITYSGVSEAAMTTCTVEIDITGDVIGLYTNTSSDLNTNTSSDLTSSRGNCGSSSATLLIVLASPSGSPTPIPAIGVWGLLLLISVLGVFFFAKNS